MSTRSYQYRKTPIYGNCLAVDPEGTPMFRCDDHKSNWYLSRDLAEIISTDPLIMRLKFTPKGKGHFGDSYYLGEKENKCVVCGSDNVYGLTRHHIVPFLYRRLFPDHLKHFTSHDIVPLCGDCHARYEEASYFERVKIGLDYGFPYNQYKEFLEVRRDARWYAVRAATTLAKYGSQIPSDRKKELELKVENFTGKPFSEDDFKLSEENEDLESSYAPEDPNRRHARLVIEKILADNALGEFNRRWRQHFLDTMKPKYMPSGWSVDRVDERK